MLKTLQYDTSKSAWPIFTSFFMFYLLLSFYSYITFNTMIIVSLIMIIFTSMLWFKDLSHEGSFKGGQNLFMQSSLKLGMVFFILSEVFFFISFFWSYFHYMFMQSGELGMQWPSKGLNCIDYLSIPLLNSLLLLSSGVSLTVSHHMLLLEKNFNSMLMVTIFLGLFFSTFQYWEYKMLDFLWSDSCYGSIFFMGTGFHGLHVIVGMIILSVVLFRSLFKQILNDSLIFELGAWYWHFVDVIWIVLFTEFYWWSV